MKRKAVIRHELSNDEERLLNNYRHAKKETEELEVDEFSCAGCCYPTKNGNYIILIRGQFVGDEKP